MRVGQFDEFETPHDSRRPGQRFQGKSTAESGDGRESNYDPDPDVTVSFSGGFTTANQPMPPGHKPETDGTHFRRVTGLMQAFFAETPWIMIWVFGSMTTAIFFLARWHIGMRRLCKTLRCPSDRILDLADDICESIGLAKCERSVTDWTSRHDTKQLARCRRGVIVCLSKEEFGPAVVGLFRPTIILPWSLRDGSKSELRHVLAHELMHVLRRDAAVSLVQSIARCIWWFHPLYWLADRRLVAAREQCCDEQTVIQLDVDPADYAQQLLNTLSGKINHRFGKPALAMSSAGVINQRLEHLMTRHEFFKRSTPRCYWCVAILFALLVLPGASGPQETPDGSDEQVSNRSTASPLNQTPSTASVTRAVNVSSMPSKPVRNHTATAGADGARVNLADRKQLWEFDLGTETASRPLIVGGRVYIQVLNADARGTQNPAGRLLCLSRKTGELLWNYESAPAAQGVTHKITGILPAPIVEDTFLYYSTPAAKVVCIDLAEVVDHVPPRPIWEVDLIRTCGTWPGHLAAADIAIAGDLVLLSAINHRRSGTRVPVFEMLAIDRHHGGVVWQGKPLGPTIDVSWSGPTVARIGEIHQVVFPCSDGCLYAFDLAEIATGNADPIWWFNCNPKDSTWMLGNEGTKNSCVTTPVVIDNRVYVAVGQDPEHGEGVGNLWCIDPTRRGDLNEQAASAVIWHQSRQTPDAEFSQTVHRSIAPPTVADGVLVLADYSGLVHGFRASDGKQLWSYDAFAMIFGQPLIVGDEILVTDEDGDLVALSLNTGEVITERNLKGRAYPSPILYEGTLYLVADRKLFPLGT